MDNYRIEHDSMGEISVPMDRYWGAQTQRSFENFRIGSEKMPMEIIFALALYKKAAAQANEQLGRISAEKAEMIGSVADEILAGELNEHFPLSVWQTGSGTQSNMNVNEVIANRAGVRYGTRLLHPNDDVNASQSSNDAFPSAIHIAFVLECKNKLLPAVEALRVTFAALSRKYARLLKTGRTHLQDAAPLSLGQEIGAWEYMLKADAENILRSLDALLPLAAGGTAVGTGLNAPKGFDEVFCQKLNALCGEAFRPSENKFYSLSSKSALAFSHGSLKALASDLLKIANDVRLLSSGPRCGIGEINIPENEPGSSIMPGKVNPTQCEALSMVAVQVMGNDAQIGFAASQGNYQLNVYMPLIANSAMQSIRLLSDAIQSFNKNCAVGITANEETISRNLHNSLMLVTALNPYIGYENSAKIAKTAHAEQITLREAAVRLNMLTEQEFDRAMNIEKMVFPEENE